jgi:hypothetical protein
MRVPPKKPSPRAKVSPPVKATAKPVKVRVSSRPVVRDGFAASPRASSPAAGTDLLKDVAAQAEALLRDDPALRQRLATVQVLSAHRAAVVAALQATQLELAAWRKEKGGLASMTRVLDGIGQAESQLLDGEWEFWKGVKKTITDPELDEPAPQRARIAELARQLRNVDLTIAGVSEGRTLAQSVPPGDNSYQLEELAKLEQGKVVSGKELLGGRLEHLKKDVRNKDLNGAVTHYQATVVPYLVTANASGESIQGLPGGKQSFTGLINQLISSGQLENGGKLVSSAQELEALLTDFQYDFAQFAIDRDLKPKAKTPIFEKIAALAGIDVSKDSRIKNFRAIEALAKGEMLRLSRLDSQEPLASVKGTIEVAQAQLDQLRKSTDPGFFKSSLSKVGEILDSPATWAMLGVGALTDGLAVAVMGESAVGVGEVAVMLSAGNMSTRAAALFATTATVDGAAFHSGMNVFNLARGKPEQASWQLIDYLSTIAMFASLGTVKLNALAREATSMERAAAAALNVTTPTAVATEVVSKALGSARLLGEEAATLTMLGAAEAALRAGDGPKAGELLKQNFAFLLTMRMLHSAKSLVPGTADARIRELSSLGEHVLASQQAWELDPSPQKLETFYGQLRAYAARMAELNHTLKRAGITDKTQQLFRTKVDVVNADQFKAILAGSLAQRLNTAKTSEHKRELKQRYAELARGGAFYDPVTARTVVNHESTGDLDPVLRHEFTHQVFHSMDNAERASLLKLLPRMHPSELDEQLARWNTVASGAPMPEGLRQLDSALGRVTDGQTVAQKYGVDLRALSRGELMAKMVDQPLETQSGAQDPLGMPSLFSKAKGFLALAGVGGGADVEAARKIATEVTERARANKAAVPPKVSFFEADNLKAAAQGLLGINSGPDQTEEVRIHTSHENGNPIVKFQVLDRAGFHVMSASVRFRDPGGGWIGLAASHGRDSGELEQFGGAAKVPGRGNALLVAAGLESILVEGSKHGLYRLGCEPASDKVAELYARMGFKTLDGSLPAKGKEMWLDLTDEEVTRKALVSFVLGRGQITDVPKDVAQRLVAEGGNAPVPRYDRTRPATAIVRNVVGGNNAQRD